MAKSTTTASYNPTKQLRKLLQTQQEPFALEVYISEKGFRRNNLTTNSDANFILTSGNKSGTKNKSNKSGIIPHFPKLLKLVLCNMFFTFRGLRRTKSSNKQDNNRFSSSSCSVQNNSSSESDIDGNSNSSKLDTEKEERKQYSPQSVLEAISTSTDGDDTVSSTEQERFILPKLITEESILSATLWKSKEQSSCRGFSMSDTVSQQQTKQLLLDCVRELVDDHGKFLGSEEIGNFICEKIKGCGKTNIKEMLELDVMESKHEWDEFEIESRKRKIGKLLGNTILEELTSEVVMDMVDVIVH